MLWGWALARGFVWHSDAQPIEVEIFTALIFYACGLQLGSKSQGVLLQDRIWVGNVLPARAILNYSLEGECAHELEEPALQTAL